MGCAPSKRRLSSFSTNDMETSGDARPVAKTPFNSRLVRNEDIPEILPLDSLKPCGKRVRA